jgi:hypothetical protein
MPGFQQLKPPADPESILISENHYRIMRFDDEHGFRNFASVSAVRWTRFSVVV